MVAVWAIRSRSATEVAVRSLAERLAPGDPEVAATSAVATLERAIGDAQSARHEAEGIRAHLQRSLNAIPQGVIIADDAGEIVSRNHVATLFAQARHGDAVVQAAIEELLAEALDGLPGRRTVELFETPRRMLVISATPLDEDGRLTGAMVVVDDISERRRLDVVRRDFVANISHELKTPVAAMSLLAETLAGEDDPEVTRRLAERVQSEAFRGPTGPSRTSSLRAASSTRGGARADGRAGRRGHRRGHRAHESGGRTGRHPRRHRGRRPRSRPRR